MRIIVALLVALFAAQVAQAQSYAVKPGDILRVEVLEDTSLNRDVLVAPDGQFTFPLAGTVRAGGRSIDQIAASLSQQLAPNYAAPPNVFISLSRLAPPTVAGGGGVVAAPPTISIYVLGEVNNPGKREVEPGTTLLQFFAESGGFTRFAATKRIQLRRRDQSGAEQVYSINYRAIEAGGQLKTSVTMQDGDVIVVPQRRLFE